MFFFCFKRFSSILESTILIATMQKLPSNDQRNQRAGGINFATIKIVIHVRGRCSIQNFGLGLSLYFLYANSESSLVLRLARDLVSHRYDIFRRLLITFAKSLDPDQIRQNVRSIMIILEYDIFRRLLITFANSLDPDQAQQNVRSGPTIRRA